MSEPVKIMVIRRDNDYTPNIPRLAHTGYRPNMQGESAPILPPASPPMDEYGVSGLNRFGQWVYEEWHRELQGRKGMIAYREMWDNEAVIDTILKLFNLLALQVKWSAKPKQDTPTHIEQSDFVENCMGDMEFTWSQFISDALTVVPFGFYYGEIVYKVREDGKIGWGKISSRSQETLDGWAYDEKTKKLLGMFQRPPYGPFAFIPKWKALHIIYGFMRENPEGRSALRGAYLSYKACKELRRFEGIGFERNVAGMPIARVPVPMLSESASAEDQATVASIKKLVWQLKMDERMGVVFPADVNPDGTKSGYDLDFASPQGGQAQAAINTSITRYEQRMAMVLLAEFIMLGMQKAGSYSMHSDKTSHFAMAVYAVLDMIADALNKHVIPDLMKYNGITDKELWPTITHGDIEKPELNLIAQFIKTLFEVGVDLTDDETQTWLKKLADLPTKAVKEL